MSYSIASIDTVTLPEAMLDMAKKHCRVDFSDDDESITEYLAWSIGYLENFWELQIFGGEVTFVPDGGTATVQCPVHPVSSDFTASDADGDVTIDYVMQGSASLTNYAQLSRVDSALIPAGVTFTLVTGYSDPADMHPSMRGNILRAAATMYEHRESITTLTLDQMPFWMSDIMGGLWTPRC